MGLVLADDGWRIPDEVWAQMEPLLPERPAHPLGCHNPRVPDREAMNAILLVLCTGMQWNALGDRDLLLLLGLPALPGVGRGGRLSRVLAARPLGLRRGLRARVGVAGPGRRARQGAARRRADRAQSHRQGKKGAKRSLLTEGTGVPLGIAPAGANLNDFKLDRATLESIPIALPEPTLAQPQGLCLDKRYDYPEVYELAAEFGFTAHVRSRGEEAQALKQEPASVLAAGSSSAPTPGSTASAASSSAGRNAPTPTWPCSTSPAA